jgi:signal transduction histidine kinase
MGTILSMNSRGWEVQTVEVTGYAIQAGIRVGDRPLEINGQSAEKFLEKYTQDGIVNSRLIEEMTVVDEHGLLKSASLKDGSPSWESVLELTIIFIVCLTFWVTGFYVFFKRTKNPAALMLCLLGLIVGLAFSGNAAAERGIPTAYWVEASATLFSPWLLLHFFLVLPEERAWPHKNPLVYLIYLPAAITLILFPFVGYADGQSLPWFRSLRLIEYGVGFLATISVVIFNYLHSISFKTQQQMKIVLISCIAALVPFLVLNILPEAIWGRTILPTGFSVLFIAFIPLGMGYAVVTKKLMDIDVIIRRGIIYGLITLILTAVLSAAIFFVLAYQESLEVFEEILIALALGSIATVLFGPVRKGVEFLVDRFFYKDRYDYRKIIQSLGISLNSAKDLTDVSRLIVGTTVNTLNLAGGCLFVKTRSNTFQVSAAQGIFIEIKKHNELLTLLSQHNHAIEFPNTASTVNSDLAYLIPLVVVEEEIGFLCVSQKASRQNFSSDDVFLLQGIAFAAALELHGAMLIRDVSIRDTFVSVASHELRTPLTSIVGYADLLLHRNPPDTIKKRWVKKILDNGQRLSSMVDDLLNVSRIQSGKVGLTLEKVRLSEVLEEALSLAKEYTDKHEFVVDIEPDLPVVLIDRDKLGQVVGNLLSNAVKYSPNGGRITLSVHNELEKHQIVISIADEGIGISPADKESLFTTFHRIQRPETQGIRGSGLGLYIAKEWTEAMGGKIWLESELNKGSTFFLAIPTQTSIVTRDKSYTHSGQL